MNYATDKFSDFGLATMAGYYLSKGKIREAKQYLNELINRLNKKYYENFQNDKETK